MAIPANLLSQLQANPASTSLPPSDTAGTVYTEEAQTDVQAAVQGSVAPPEQAQAPQESPQETQTNVSAETGLSAADSAELDRLLAAKYGFSQEELDAQYTEYKQSEVTTAVTALKQLWGNPDDAEMTRRFTVLQAQYGSLIETTPGLNTVEGLNGLWTNYAKQNAGLNRPSTSAVQSAAVPAYDYTADQLLGMSQADYAAQQDRIFAAYANNRVKH